MQQQLLQLQQQLLHHSHDVADALKLQQQLSDAQAQLRQMPESCRSSW